MKKKMFSVLALGLIFGSYTAPFTELGAVEIDTQAQTVKEACNYTNGDSLEFSYFDNITLTGDVTCNGNTIESSKYMYGDMKGYTFDGQGHTISDAVITSGTGSYKAIGLFNGIDETATVKDVNFDRITAKGSSTDANVGVLAGLNDGGTIENVTVTNSVINGSTNIGGIVGTNNGDITGEVKDSTIKSTGQEGSATGGVVGRNVGTADVKATNLIVSGVRNLGGAIGSNDGGNAKMHAKDTKVYSTVDSTTTVEHDMDDAVGRDIGGALGSNNGGTVHDSVATGGTVTGSKTIGGLVGWNAGMLTNSESTVMTVTGNNSVGGVAGKTDEKADNGKQDTINNTRSNATVIANDSYAGGIVGLTAEKSIVQHAWYEGDSVTAAASAGGVIGTNASGGSYENINNMSGAAAVDAQDDRLEGCLIGYDTDTDGPINGDGTNCVSDTVAPTLTANAEATIEAGSTEVDYVSLFNAIATDETDASIQDKITTDDSAVNLNAIGDYPVIFNVSDAAGNKASSVTSTLHVVDTTAPVITADTDVYVNVGTTDVDYINDFSVVATDNLDGDITSSVIVDDSVVDLNTIGDYPVTFNVSDASGIAADAVTSTLHVKDATAPVITTEAEATVEAGSTNVDYISLFNVVATDNLDGNVTIDVDDSTVDLGTVGDYSVVFSSTDSDMNMSTVTTTLHVVDTTAPVITLVNSEVDAYVGETIDYTSFVTNVTDNADQTLTAEDVIIDATLVNMKEAGDYEVYYTVADASGNVSDQEVLTIHVQEDTEAPVITLTEEETTIDLGTEINEEFFASYIADVTDNATTDMEIRISHNINSNVVGDYTATYTATDLANNVSDEAVLLVHVVDNSTNTEGNNDTTTTDNNESSEEELTNTGSTVGIALVATTVLVGILVIIPSKRG